MNRKQQIIGMALAQARRLREVHGEPRVIGLSVYDSDEDLRQLRPEDGPEATCAQQREMTEAVAVALRADGHVVRLVRLRAVDYLRWLSETGKSNHAANRADWITQQLS